MGDKPTGSSPYIVEVDRSRFTPHAQLVKLLIDKGILSNFLAKGGESDFGALPKGRQEIYSALAQKAHNSYYNNSQLYTAPLSLCRLIEMHISPDFETDILQNFVRNIFGIQEDLSSLLYNPSIYSDKYLHLRYLLAQRNAFIMYYNSLPDEVKEAITPSHPAHPHPQS
jgi:hypothetical protein